jgi:hypothetical protein
MTLQMDKWLILLSLSGLLLTVTVARQMFEPEKLPEKHSTQAAAPSRAVATLLLPPRWRHEREYSAISAKPLFFESRRIPEIAVLAKPPVVVTRKPELQVLGIISENGRHTALIRLEKASTIRPFSPGELISGWMIESITPKDLILVRDERRELYGLSIYPSLPLHEPLNQMRRSEHGEQLQ